MLDNPEADKRAHEDQNDSLSKISDVLNQEIILRTKRMVTPRTWANTIGPFYKDALIDLFEENPDGISGKEYY